MLQNETQETTRWRVLKFGGTSVASRERWIRIAEILRSRTSEGFAVALVCSAISGVTDLLSELVVTRRKGLDISALLDTLEARHHKLGKELGINAQAILAGDFETLRTLLSSSNIAPRAEAAIIGHGELMSTRLGAAWLSKNDVPCAWVDARELLIANTYPQDDASKYLCATCSPAPDEEVQSRLARRAQVIVTQGFIAASEEGETVLLGRGGSDTSAAYIACLLAAEKLEIWTDVPGLFTANPRLIPEARLLRRIGYRGAQALGALGAKVLHPRAIEAVWEHGIPVELGWTEHPEVHGTTINASRATVGIKAITSRRNLLMFSLRRPPSWQPVGFLADVAACFATRGLSMDLLSSSCSEIRCTLDLSAFPSVEAELPEILGELEKTCEVRLIRPVASVSLVGKNVNRALFGEDQDFGLSEEALLMVVHAANENHVSVVLVEEAAEMLVARAHQRLIEEAEGSHELGATWNELLARKTNDKGEAEWAM
jgi:diaminopimelate decarboxylase/aspartate kinase